MLTYAAAPAFYRLAFARFLSGTAYQMLTVALGWQLYALTNSALDLGLVGLVSFFPMLLATPFAGHVADTFDRRHIAAVMTSICTLIVFGLAFGTWAGWTGRGHILASVAVLGMVRAFEFTSMSALMPLTVPREVLSRATAIYASANQTSVILGPALGGLLSWLGAALPYTVAALCFATSAIAILRLVTVLPQVRRAELVTLDTLTAGFRFIWRTPDMLGAMSLDLVSFGLGSAFALMPMIAKDVLDVGPLGLGILRAAPAVGALAMAIWLARHPVTDKAGLKYYGSVAGFGLATIAFGLTASFTLAFAALVTIGAVDAVGVVIRQSLVQLRTPDEMRGRVGAVNAMFIAASNQLGDFRAGVMAAAFGPTIAIVLGGATAIAVAVLWMRLFPSLANLQRAEQDAPR